MRFKKTVSALAALAMSVTAFAGLTTVASAVEETVTATLAHTFSAQGGSNTAGTFVDTETHYYNNWGTSGWVATAYSDFTFDAGTLPETSNRITKATLTTYINCARGTRTVAIAKVPLTTIGYNAETGEYSIPMISAPSTIIASYSDVTTDYKAYEVDVTDSVKAMIDDGESEILFAYSNGAAGGYIYGKGSTDYKPSLTVNVASAETVFYDVTVNVVCDDEVLSVTTESVEEGTSFTPTYETSFDKNGYRYTYVSGGDKIESVGSDTVINLVYSKRPLAKTILTVNYLFGTEILATNSETELTEGVTTSIGYPKYIFKDGKLYNIAQSAMGGGYYSMNITGTGENQAVDITYTEVADANAVYYSEAEDLGEDSGIGNSLVRCSNGKAYKVPTTGMNVTTLPAGIYTIEAAVWGTKDDTYTFKAGDSDVLSLITTGALVTNTSAEFTLTADTVITVTGTAEHSSGLDYILIKKTGDYVAPEPVVPPTVTVTEPANNVSINKDTNTYAKGCVVNITPSESTAVTKLVWKIYRNEEEYKAGKNPLATSAEIDLGTAIQSGGDVVGGIVVLVNPKKSDGVTDVTEADVKAIYVEAVVE